MDILRAIQAIRTPFGDSVFSAITYLGDEIVFLGVTLAILWCFDKKWGYRLFFIGLAGNALNQLLKAIFVIPRPWVQDPSFQIVESAKEAATGYSFPSGHTQSVTSVFGTIATWLRRWWAQLACAVLILLTAFSRMYLGVHTLLDVGVSLGTGILTVALLSILLQRHDGSVKARVIISLSGLLFAVLALVFVVLSTGFEGHVAEFDQHGMKSISTIIGPLAAFCIIWPLEEKYIKFETRAVWWAQLLKLAIGLGIAIAAKSLLKAPLHALIGNTHVADGLRYFILAMLAGGVWPLTFRFWAKLGNRKEEVGNSK